MKELTGIERMRQIAWDAAIEKGSVLRVRTLIAAGADPALMRSIGEPSLSLAVLHGHKEVVELLLAKGADVNVENSMGHSPLHTALSRRHARIVNVLLAAGARTNFMPQSPAKDYLTPFQMMVKAGRLDEVRRFVAERGGDLNQLTVRRKTLGQLAGDNRDMLSLLLGLREQYAADRQPGGRGREGKAVVTLADRINANRPKSGLSPSF